MEDKKIDLGNGLVEHIRHWDNGNICEHYTKLNGKYHGEYRYYFSNGKLSFHEYNKNDEIEGEYLDYYYD